MTDKGDWILDLERKVRRYSLVFIHLGSAFSPLRRDLDDIEGKRLAIVEYLDQPAEDQPTLYVLKDFERASTTTDTTIGRLRERVFSDIDAGHLFILVSTKARNSFEAGPGSDLLADSRQVFAPLNPHPAGEQLAVLPAYCDGELDGSGLLIECLEELGSSTVLALSQALWEEGLSPSESIKVLERSDIEVLRGAGFIHLHQDSVAWAFPQAWKKLKNAVALVSSRYTEETAWLSSAFTDLWVVERVIRNVIRDALIAKQGESWRDGCLNAKLRADVLERARKDAQPSAGSIKELRDPLEWLTTVELLELREQRELGGLGLESYLWRKLRNDVIPIRNRAAHMRLIGAHDARVLRNWRAIVQKRVMTQTPA
jgi:hypothetical protein